MKPGPVPDETPQDPNDYAEPEWPTGAVALIEQDLRPKVRKAAYETEERDDHGRWTAGGDSGSGWKPTMTVDEAEEWAKDSKVKGAYYHGTDSESAAESIKQGGFNLSQVSAGGKGVYLVSNKEEAGDYAGRGGVTLETRVNVRNPAPERVLDKVFEEMWPRVANGEINQGALGGLMTERMRSMGYDSVRQSGGQGRVVVVFDKQSVTVVKR